MCLAAGVARPLTHLPQQGPAGGEQQQAAEAPPAEASQQPGTSGRRSASPHPSGRRSASPHPSGRRSASPHPSAGGVWLALPDLMRHGRVMWKGNVHASEVTCHAARAESLSDTLQGPSKALVANNPGHSAHDASPRGFREEGVRGLQPAAQVADHMLLVAGQPVKGDVGVWAALTDARQGCT